MPDRKRTAYMTVDLPDGTRRETIRFTCGDVHVANGEVWLRPVDDQRMVRFAKEVDGGWTWLQAVDHDHTVYTDLRVSFV